jgi:hypothetical protein
MESEAEKRVAEKLKEYTEAAKDNKKIDKAALAIAALEAPIFENRVSAKMKKWAYLISLGLPPFGLGFAVYYYFSNKTDGKRVAIVCVIVTVLAAIMFWVSFSSIFSSVPPGTLDQIQSLKPDDIKSIMQNGL